MRLILLKLNSITGLTDIRDWMAANFLKLNDDKTEHVLSSNPRRLAKNLYFELSVGNVKVKLSLCDRHLGPYTDSSLSFKTYIKNCCHGYI